MNATVVLGFVAGAFTSSSLVPQLAKIIKTKKAEDISYATLVVLIGGVSGWIVYGVLSKDWPVIVTNAFALIVNLLVLAFSVRYKRHGV